MIIRKVDCNETAFKAELMTNAKISAKKRFKFISDTFREQTKNFSGRKFFISQISDDLWTLQLQPKNMRCTVDGVYTESLDKLFERMDDNVICKFFYSSFKLLALSERYRELSNLINAARAECQHNMELLKKFSEQGNADFIKRYKKFSQINAIKIKALTREINNIRNDFYSLKERAGKKYPELLDVSL